jgi:hypothetical protein
MQTFPRAFPQGFSIVVNTAAVQITTTAVAFVRELFLGVDRNFTGQVQVGFTSAIVFSTTTGTAGGPTLTGGSDKLRIGPEEAKGDASNVWLVSSTTGCVVRGWLF